MSNENVTQLLLNNIGIITNNAVSDVDKAWSAKFWFNKSEKKSTNDIQATTTIK